MKLRISVYFEDVCPSVGTNQWILFQSQRYVEYITKSSEVDLVFGGYKMADQPQFLAPKTQIFNINYSVLWDKNLG